MTRAALLLAALVAPFFMPITAAALLALAAGFFFPLAPLAGGVLEDALYYAQGAAPFPLWSLAGALASGAFFLLARELRGRMMIGDAARP